MRARIYQPARNPMQSGQAKTGEWILEFQPSSATKIDPLMGWSGSKGSSAQVKMSFVTKDEAVAFAESRGVSYEILETKSRSRKQNIRKLGYSENFSVARRMPWTH